MLLGTRLQSGREGRRLGVAMAFAWAAYPFTLLGLQSNVNDGLSAVLLVFALLALTSPAKRGLMVGLAAAAKFAPVALVPLFATARARSARRAPGLSSARAFAAVVAALDPALPARRRAAGVLQLHDRLPDEPLLRVQPLGPAPLARLAPGHREGGRSAVRRGAGLRAAPARPAPGRRPRRRRDHRRAAGAVHWFYFYIPWFTPFALLAMFGAYRAARARGRARRGAGDAGASRPPFKGHRPRADRV